MFSYVSILNPGFATVTGVTNPQAGTLGYVSFLNPPGTGGGTGGADGGNIVAVSGSTAASTGTVAFWNSNGVSFGLNGTRVTASHNGYTGATSNFLTTTPRLNEVRAPNGDAFFVMGSNQIQFQFSNVGTFTTSPSRQGLFEIDCQGNLVDGADVVHIHQSDNDPTIDLLHIQGAGTNVTALRIEASASIAAEINKPLKFTHASTVSIGSVPFIMGTGMSNSVSNLNVNYLQGRLSSYFAVSNHSHALATTTTNGASIVVATSGSAGYTLAVPAYLTTAGATNAITTAAQVSHSHAFATTTTNGSNVIVATSNSNGVTLAVPPFITAAAGGGGATVNGSTGNVSIVAGANITLNTAGSTISIVGAAPGAGGGVAVAGSGASTVTSGTLQFANLNGVSFGLNGSTMTASYSSNHTHGNGSLALTNLTGTTASASNGWTISLSAAAPGAGGGVAIGNTASSNAFTSGSVMFSGLANITVNTSANGASQYIQISAPNPGGGAAPAAYYAVPVWGQGSQSNALLTNITGISRQFVFFPFENIGNLTYNELHWPMSRATAGSNNFSVFMAIYSYSNSSRLDTVFSTSGQFSATNTASVSGLRGFELTFASQSLSPGQYVLGLMFDPVGGNTASMNYSMMGAATGNSMLQTQVINGADQYHTNVNHLWIPGHGRFSVTSAAVPASVPLASILAQGNNTNNPLPMYWVLGTHYA